MSTDDYEFSGTLSFSNDELKKELHQIALNGLKAFVDAYETAYLGTTILGNGIKISVEDNTRLPYATLGASATGAKELYDWTVTMKDCYDEAKSISETYIGNTNPVDVVSEVTTQISNVTKLATDIVELAGESLGKKAGIVSSVIGFAGAAIATFDGTSKAEKDALVKSGIDLVGEGLKLALKAIPVVGVVGSVGIDVGVDLAKILVENIYDTLKNLDDTDALDSSFAGKYREGLISVDSAMDTTLSKYNIPKFTSGDDNVSNVYNKQSDIFMNALSGNDKITNDGSRVTIIGGSGNDTVNNSGGKSLINGGTDDDYISNNWNYVTINGGEDNDTINNSGNYVTIDGGAGNDSIYNYSGYNSFSNSNYYLSYVTITGGTGDDTIRNGGDSVVVDGGTGEDYISVEGDSISINAGLGNDYIGNAGEYITIDGGQGNDTISTKSGGGKRLITGGDGNDYIYLHYGMNLSVDDTILGSSGNDVIMLGPFTFRTVIQYSNVDGDDTISGFDENHTLQILWASYTTVQSGDDIIIKVGDGSILLEGAANTAVNIQGTLATDTVSTVETAKNIQVANSSTIISGTKYNDTITNGTSGGLKPRPSGNENVTIVAGEGIDSIENCGKNVSVNAGAGDDIIDNYGTNVTIRGDSDNDWIINWYGILSVIDGGNGDDTLTNMFVENSIYGGNGNDKIVNGTWEIGDTVYYGHYSLLDGGAGDDEITNQGKKVTIKGGAGNDIISDDGINNTFVYSNGDGNDIIFGVDSSDTLQITGAKCTTTKSGNDLIIGVGKGSILVYDGADVNFKIEGTLEGGGSSNETLPAGISIKNSIVTAAKTFTGNEINLSNFFDATKVNVSALSKAVEIIGNDSNNSIKGGKGADTISGNSGKDTISSGAGNDIIYGGADNDLMKGEAGNDTLYGGTGNDTLTGGTGNDVFIYEGGNDIISDYFTGENKIKLVTGNIISSSLKSSDIILKTSAGSITVKNGKDKKITIIYGSGNTSTEIYGKFNYNNDKSTITLASTFTGSLKADDYATTVKTINGTGVSKVVNIFGNAQNNTILGSIKAETIYGGAGNDSILGNAGNDKLYGDSGADSLNGGKGNDTLTGGDGADVFFYASGEGNDVIVDFTAGQDSINLTNGTIASASLKSSDMVFKIGSGTLTVKNGKNQEIAIGNSIYYNNLVYDKNKSVITIGAGFSGSLKSSDYVTTVKTINAGGVTKSTNIIGNAQDNTIIGSSKAETIYGGTGNDSIIGNAGNDKIYGDAGNDKLLGGEGNDSLYGGTGNDTLTGEKGNDFFVYEGGNDLITDYTAGQDKIKINSGKITKTGYNGNAVTFTVGSGTITVQNGKGKKITIIDANNKTTTQTYTQDVSYKAASNARWFTADDNNFITDEIQISDIAKMQESNYSAIQANVVENKNELAITDAVFSAISSDKK